MPKNHVIYNQRTLLVGPAPSTGYHSIGQDGALNGDVPTANNFSLLFPIHRAISSSYSYTLPRFDVQQVGDLGTIKSPILIPTEVELNIDYYLMGLSNDVRLGLMANIPSGDNITGPPLYGTGRVPILSGLVDRRFERSRDTSVGWPLTTREPRNIFALVAKDALDVNNKTEISYGKDNNYYTIGFGDCYMSSYSTSASVNSLPQSQVRFISSNIVVYNGASGQVIPSINATNYTANSGMPFYIPSTFEGTGIPTVFLPKDITLSIKTSSNVNPSNIGFDFNDIKLQSYNISFDLSREPLVGVGHSYPLDRPINFPSFVNVSFDAIVGDNLSGSLLNLVRRDEEYDISIKLTFKNNNYFSGVGIQYDILKAKFNQLTDNLSIGNREIANFSFVSEMKPNDVTRGLFLSGYLGIPSRTLFGGLLVDDFFGLGSNSYLITEDGNYIAVYADIGKRISY